MRRVGVVLLLALAAVAGCGTRSTTIPGAAAPLTGTGTAAPARTPATGGPGTRGPTAGGPAASGSTGPSAGPLPPVPTDFRTMTMTGFGVTVTVPAPAAWTSTPSRSAALVRTDVGLADPEVLLRFDLGARGPGSAEDGAVRDESATRLEGYRRLGITKVAGVGEDAVDWAFTFERDGTRQVVDRRILAGTAAVAVYYSAPSALYQRYLPVWERAVRDLAITTR